jgi:hypothetical protein
MAGSPVKDLVALGRQDLSPIALNDKLWGVLTNSLAARIKIESCNWETGEYRVVLQGTLDLEPPDEEAST